MPSSAIFILRASLASAAFIGVATVFFRIVGLERGEALYLACLSFVLVAYILSRRALRRRERD